MHAIVSTFRAIATTVQIGYYTILSFMTSLTLETVYIFRSCCCDIYFCQIPSLHVCISKRLYLEANAFAHCRPA